MSNLHILSEAMVKDLAELQALVELHKFNETEVLKEGVQQAQELVEEVTNWVRYKVQQLGFDF